MSEIIQTVSVIIVTLNRPEFVRRCLTCLFNQTQRPNQIIVVDASKDDLTQNVAAEFPNVIYRRNENGYGRMTSSRNIGLKIATGEMIAFLDDDAFAHERWLTSLIAAYTDSSIGAVGGRALNQQPNEANLGVSEIGQLKRNGDLTGNFAADPKKIIEVDHVMGCNMSFRREVVAVLGGFREDYPGISGVREDSDMCLRVKRLGYRILFNPSACVDHVSAPQAKGQRFDLRYCYYLQRNHLCLLVRNYGFGAGIVWRYFLYSAYQPVFEFLRRIGAAFGRISTVFLATIAGALSGILLLLRTGREPARTDQEGQRIRSALSENAQENSRELEPAASASSHSY